ncbi:hypothetical protein GCM10010401_16680 [Rarobacter faecitabidus]|uniref:ATP synthase epsilon chain n=1 Tax=Rarobacter faecitabidus TaxID=13243 RepID=A0A542ZXA1_RARFA|nr:F0F1 ATP synthase subunit epsilon [Rarobacter faecitabidus]TQL64929.1 ATP synthase F1 subcomplex epsilon subunit [Rarobacter faecitabidus]
MANLKVNVVSSTSTLWQGEAKMVVAPAADGEIGLLAGHTPLLSVMRQGEVRITPLDGGARVSVTVSGGFLSVDDDQVTVVAEDAELTTTRN